MTATVSIGVISELDKAIPQIIAELVESLGRDLPEYAEFLASETDEVATLAREAWRQLVAMADPEAGLDSPGLLRHETFAELGRLESRSGRSLRTLLAAYRTGARIAWRHVAAAGISQGMAPEALAALAEAVFAFVDELSDASARGYAEEQSRSSAARERQRLALSELLLSGTAELSAIDALATEIGWTRPASLAVVVAGADALDSGDADVSALADRLGPTALPARRRGLLAAVVEYSGLLGERRRLTATLRGCRAVVGLPGSAGELPQLVASAELALALVGRGVLAAAEPLFVEDQLAALIVHRDPTLLAALAARRLAPLSALPAATRMRLAETLQVWLDQYGDRRATAAALNVHVQTVRYRVEQLRRLFGDALDDPKARFELGLALRANRG